MAYRAVLATPGVRALTAVGFLARVPATASAIALTLHVVLTLRLGYAAAGLVAAASTIGMAVGAPLLGRLVDRRGLRLMLSVALVAECAFWSVAPLLRYPWLLAGAGVAGLLGVPVYSVIRQSLVALVPADRRRTAFALDSMSLEIAYLVGPTAATLVALHLSTPVALWLIGAGRVAGGLALWVVDPPSRAPAADTDDVPVSPQAGPSWRTARLGGALLATGAAVFLLFGTELVMISSLQTSGQTTAIPLVSAVWSLASLCGGFVYGRLRRGLPLAGLVAALAVVTTPVALGGPWWVFALLLVPSGVLCAPALAASADTVSGLAPDHARGLVIGLHGSAITGGGALAAPLSGILIDATSPQVAVLVVAAVGAGVAVVAGLLMRARAPAPAPTPP